jgi:hypothetical protein
MPELQRDLGDSKSTRGYIVTANGRETGFTESISFSPIGQRPGPVRTVRSAASYAQNISWLYGVRVATEQFY